MQPGDQHPSRRGILADFWGTGLTSGRDTEVIDELTPDAFMSDVAPFMVVDGTADFSRGEHVMALDYVAKRVGRVETTDAVIEALDATAHRNVPHDDQLTAALS